jgi:hypothetical protein
MADITMCTNALCPNAMHCKRVQAIANEHYQSWQFFQYTASDRGVECEHYWPIYPYYETTKKMRIDHE